MKKCYRLFYRFAEIGKVLLKKDSPCTHNASGYVEPNANVTYYNLHGVDCFPKATGQYSFEEQIQDGFDEYTLFPYLCIRACGALVPGNGMWCPACISGHQARLKLHMPGNIIDLSLDCDSLNSDPTTERVAARVSSSSANHGSVATTPQHKCGTLGEQHEQQQSSPSSRQRSPRSAVSDHTPNQTPVRSAYRMQCQPMYMMLLHRIASHRPAYHGTIWNADVYHTITSHRIASHRISRHNMTCKCIP